MICEQFLIQWVCSCSGCTKKLFNCLTIYFFNIQVNVNILKNIHFNQVQHNVVVAYAMVY